MNAKKNPARKPKITTARTPSGTSHPAPIKKRRILLVDDHPLTREGLAGNINRQADLEVCAQAGNPAEAMALLPKCHCDLLVTDMTMPGFSGIEFIKDVHAMRPELAILVLSMHDEILYAERTLRAGARGYVMKDAGSAKLLEVIRLILSGHSYVSPQMSARLLDAMTGRRPRGSASPIEKLSDREFEILQLLGHGKSTKEAAKTLNLSSKTVDVHRGRIKRKLNIKDAPGLIHYAVCWVEAQTAHS
jgi:DNA-binding NarL/FixJ family response regulator